MNMAVLFQKRNNVLVKLVKKMYCSLFLNTYKKRAKYLRDAGAVIGKGTRIPSLSVFGSEPYLIEVGDNTTFSGNVQLIPHDGSIPRLHYMGLTPKPYDAFGRIKIGSNCFIGFGAIILKNVTIGDNCIIGAGSVVTKSMPANSVACGVPARVVGTVESLYEKNKAYLDDTVGMSSYEKRRYIESNMDKYEKWRMEKEC